MKNRVLERRVEKFEPPPVKEEDRALMQEAENDWILSRLTDAEVTEVQVEKSPARFQELYAVASERAAREHPYHAYEYKQKVMAVRRLRSKRELSWEEKRRLWWYTTWLISNGSHSTEPAEPPESRVTA
jgi:hypothetical protein